MAYSADTLPASVDASPVVDADFDSLLRRLPPLPPSGRRIPKSAHFIWVNAARPASWIEYAAVRSARQFLGVADTNIWVPAAEDGEGPEQQEKASTSGPEDMTSAAAASSSPRHQHQPGELTYRPASSSGDNAD